MRATRILFLLGFAVAIAFWASPRALVAAAPARSVAQAAAAAAIAPQQEQFYRPSEYFQIGATCTAEMTPDQTVILGGVSSAGLRPEDAVDQLDKELALMKSYVSDKHGSIEMMERVRTLKTPQPGRQEIDPPFQVVQRLQITFPADAPVDALLQKLIELGFDRFGDNILNNLSNRREAVIRFRVSNFDAQLNDFEKRCTDDAWKQWCNPPTATRDCPSQTPPPPPELDLQFFNVRSKETLMRPKETRRRGSSTFRGRNGRLILRTCWGM